MSEQLAIFVMGVSGSGKSTLGRKLAEALGAAFLEGDDFHPAANVGKMSTGIALQDADRWPWLDSVGHAAGDVARQRGRVVVACSALKHRYRDRLRQAAGVPALFVCLVGDGLTLAGRLRARPDHFMPASLLQSQLEALELPDATENAICLDISQPVRQAVDRIVAVLDHRA